MANYYGEIIKDPGVNPPDEEGSSSKKNYDGVRGKYDWIDYCFEFLSDTFRPILWALLGASLIITLLVLADTIGIQDFRAPLEEQPEGYRLAHAMFQSVFYFLPVMVGATAAQKLGANMWVSAAIPAALLTPEFMSLGEQGDTVNVFGLPLVINSYGSQVFPPDFGRYRPVLGGKGSEEGHPERRTHGLRAILLAAHHDSGHGLFARPIRHRRGQRHLLGTVPDQ